MALEKPEPRQLVEGWPRPVPAWMEVALAAVVATLFFGSFLVIPVAGALGLPLAAVPVVRLTHRRGFRPGVVASVLSAGAIFAVVASAGAGAFALAALALGVTLLPGSFAALARSGLDPSRAYLGLCLSGCALAGVLAGLQLAAGDRSVETEIERAFDRTIPAAIESYAKSNKDPEALERVRNTLALARQMAIDFWVGILAASWVLGAAVSFYLGARAARPAPSAEAIRFERLTVPAPAAALFVLAGAGSALLSAGARNAAGNVLLPLSALYFVTGLSIICHFARKWFRVRILRFGLYALVVYFPINVAVTLLGLFDWYANFRRRGEGAMESA